MNKQASNQWRPQAVKLRCALRGQIGYLTWKLKNLPGMEFKGIDWAGNLYQKFEAMCLEVEEVMYQDTVKYLENQVQTVGASVKKFYSEVMEDLHPLSCIDPVKVAAADLPLNAYFDTGVTKKPKQTIREDPKEVKTKRIGDRQVKAEINAESESSFIELAGVIRSPTSDGDFPVNECSELYSGKRKSGQLYRRPIVGSKGSSNRHHASKMSCSSTPVSWNPSRISSFHEIRSEVLPASDKAHDTIQANDGSHLTEEDSCRSSASHDSPASDTNLSHETATQKRDDLMSTTIPDLPSESIAADSCTHSKISSCMESTIDARTRASGGEDVISTSQGRSYKYDVDAVSDVVEPGLEIEERLAESKFEETCVLVEGNEVHAVSQKEGKHKSYKKKIREAFSSKMRSTRKQEYEKLAAQYSIEAPKLESAATCSEDLNARNLLAQPDSEWVLL